MNAKVMSEIQMLQEITKDIRIMRARMEQLADRLGEMREEMADHRGRMETRVGVIAAGVSIFFGSVAAWVVKHLGP